MKKRNSGRVLRDVVRSILFLDARDFMREQPKYRTTGFYFVDEYMKMGKSSVGVEAEVSTERMKWFESPNAEGYLDM